MSSPMRRPATRRSSAADEMIEAAKAKWDAKRRLVPGYEAKVLQARLDYDRQKSLFEKGLKPEKEIEKLKKDLDVALADLESAQLEVIAAQDDWEAKEDERVRRSVRHKRKWTTRGPCSRMHWGRSRQRRRRSGTGKSSGPNSIAW